MFNRSPFLCFLFLFVLAFGCTYSATAKSQPQFRAIAAHSSNHTCALTWTNGVVWCWGQNWWGELGNSAVPTGVDNLAAESNTPVMVLGLPGPAKAIAVGYNVSCAVINADGSVWCWGDNSYRQLGVGPQLPSFSAQPLKVVGLQAPAETVAI